MIKVATARVRNGSVLGAWLCSALTGWVEGSGNACCGMQVCCYEDSKLLKLFTDIVRMLYDCDILAEDTINWWAKKASPGPLPVPRAQCIAWIPFHWQGVQACLWPSALPVICLHHLLFCVHAFQGVQISTAAVPLWRARCEGFWAGRDSCCRYVTRDAQGSHPKGRNVFLRDMEPFLKWLDEAEEDEEEE